MNNIFTVNNDIFYLAYYTNCKKYQIPYFEHIHLIYKKLAFARLESKICWLCILEGGPVEIALCLCNNCKPCNSFAPTEASLGRWSLIFLRAKQTWLS